MPGIPGNHESREGKPHGPTKQGNPGEIPVGSDLCPLPQKTNATGQGKGQVCPVVGWALATAVRWEGRLVRGGGRGAAAELGSLLPTRPLQGAKEKLLNAVRGVTEWRQQLGVGGGQRKEGAPLSPPLTILPDTNRDARTCESNTEAVQPRPQRQHNLAGKFAVRGFGGVMSVF